MITLDAKAVVVAEGDLLLRKRISSVLSDMGHRAMPAASGHEALSAVREKADLLIIDLAITDMGATAVLECLRAEGPCLPIIAVKGEDDEVAHEPAGLLDSISRERVYPELAYKVNRALFSREKAVDSRKRAPVSITTVFTVNGRSNTGILINLSEGGAFLHTDQTLSVGSHIELTFYLEGEFIVVRGNVRWSSPSVKGSLFSGSGVMFTSQPWEAAKRISQFVDARLRELKAVPRQAV